MAQNYPGLDTQLCQIRNAGNGEGLGFFAVRDLPLGTVIFTEKPVLTIPKTMDDISTYDKLSAYAQLDATGRSRFQMLRRPIYSMAIIGPRLTAADEDVIRRCNGNSHNRDGRFRRLGTT